MTPTTPSLISDQAAGEPVAWRYLTPTGWHATTDVGKALRVKEHHTVEPLGVLSTAPTTGSAPEPEPWEMDWPQYSSSGMGCGLEDRGIHDPYDAMRYGWDEAMEQVACVLVNQTLYASPAASVLSDEQILAIWRKFAETGLCSDVLGLSRALLAASMGGDRT